MSAGEKSHLNSSHPFDYNTATGNADATAHMAAAAAAAPPPPPPPPAYCLLRLLLPVASFPCCITPAAPACLQLLLPASCCPFPASYLTACRSVCQSGLALLSVCLPACLPACIPMPANAYLCLISVLLSVLSTHEWQSH